MQTMVQQRIMYLRTMHGESSILCKSKSLCAHMLLHMCIYASVDYYVDPAPVALWTWTSSNQPMKEILLIINSYQEKKLLKWNKGCQVTC